MSDLTLKVACDYCGAQPGEPCRTSAGAEASSNHGARNAVCGAFFREGFEFGYEQGARVDGLRRGASAAV
jgi:hypothetical protein